MDPRIPNIMQHASIGTTHLRLLRQLQQKGFAGCLASSTASEYFNASAHHCAVGIHWSLAALENGLVPCEQFRFPASHPQPEGW